MKKKTTTKKKPARKPSTRKEVKPITKEELKAIRSTADLFGLFLEEDIPDDSIQFILSEPTPADPPRRNQSTSPDYYPIDMSEILAHTTGAVYITRQSVTDIASINRWSGPSFGL